MDTQNPSPEASRDIVRAAGETLELICRLRGIPVDSLSDAALGEYFFNALEDELGGAAYLNGRV
jgi:hypothetical protein